MLLKRYLVLVAGVLLFIVGYIAFFTYKNKEMEDHFRAERVKFGVQGTVLTASSSDSATGKANAVPDNSANTPVSPAADTNALIGPVPPTQESTPTPAPAAPAAPDANSTPMAPSTMLYPERQSPFMRVGYRPLAQTVQASGPDATPAKAASTVTNAVSSAATNAVSGMTNAPSEMTNAATSSTNAAPTGPARPVAIEPSVIVLLYHQFVPAGASVPSSHQWTMNVDVFENEMKYLHDNGYHVIPMSDLYKFLRHEIGLPPNSVVITIDDGYRSAIYYAAPILKKYGYPWTFFIYPQFISSGHPTSGTGAASWDDLIELQKEGVDIESHSMTHPQLTKHTQKWKGSTHTLSSEEYDEWLTNETAGSKKILEEKLGKPVVALAYPYGAYNKQVEAKALEAGYQAIFTVADNPVHSTTDPHSIGRYTITRPVEKNFAAYLRQGALGIADAEPAPGGTTSNPRPVITATLGYVGVLDPKSIETSVRDFGLVRHDFDPQTSTLRLYLPRDLTQQVNLVNIRVKDAQTGQVMVANWHFNFEAAGSVAATHPPIGETATNAAPVSTNAPAATKPSTEGTTNAAPTTNEPSTNAPSTNAPSASSSSKGKKKTVTASTSSTESNRFAHH